MVGGISAHRSWQEKQNAKHDQGNLKSEIEIRKCKMRNPKTDLSLLGNGIRPGIVLGHVTVARTLRPSLYGILCVAMGTVAEEDQDCFFKSVFRISDFNSEIKFSLTLHNISVILLTLTGTYHLPPSIPSSRSSPPLPWSSLVNNELNYFGRFRHFALFFF